MVSFSPSFLNIQKAAHILEKGGLVAFPTETVYGLGAHAFHEAGCQKIFDVKGRPSFNPLIVHCLDLESVQSLADLPKIGKKLAEEFWPGPLTLILKKRTPSFLSSLVTAGLETVAIRIPRHPVARALLKALDCPIAAPSANRSGFLSPTQAQHVLKDLGSYVDMIIEDTGVDVGLESTILDLSRELPILLREGGLEREKLEAVLKCSIPSQVKPSKITSPGQLLKHYAPRHPLRLNAHHVSYKEGLIAFGKPLEGARVSLNLSETCHLKEAAHNLFAFLHILDARDDIDSIAVQEIPEIGLGKAINDRLKRASCSLKK